MWGSLVDVGEIGHPVDPAPVHHVDRALSGWGEEDPTNMFACCKNKSNSQQDMRNMDTGGMGYRSFDGKRKSAAFPRPGDRNTRRVSGTGSVPDQKCRYRRRPDCERPVEDHSMLSTGWR